VAETRHSEQAEGASHLRLSGRERVVTRLVGGQPAGSAVATGIITWFALTWRRARGLSGLRGPQSNALSRLNCALRGARSYRLAGGRKARAELSGPKGREVELSGPNYPGRIIRAELSGPKGRGRIIRAEGQEEFLVQPGHFSSTGRTNKHGEW
jgi:hypothetical protein